MFLTTALFSIMLSISTTETKVKANEPYITSALSCMQAKSAILKYLQQDANFSMTKKTRFKNSYIIVGITTFPEKIKLPFIISTPEDNRNETTTTDRYIFVDMPYKLPDFLRTPVAKEKIMQLNNSFLDACIFPQKIYVNDKFIVFSYTFKIGSSPFPIKIIAESILMANVQWPNYYKLLQKNFKLPKQSLKSKASDNK